MWDEGMREEEKDGMGTGNDVELRMWWNIALP